MARKNKKSNIPQELSQTDDGSLPDFPMEGSVGSLPNGSPGGSFEDGPAGALAGGAARQFVSKGMTADMHILATPSTLMTILHGVASFASMAHSMLPDKWKESLPVAQKEPEEKDVISSVSMEWMSVAGCRRLLLLVLYESGGCQVWDLTNQEAVREVFSMREEHARSAQLVGSPVPDDRFPLIALVHSNRVQFFTLAKARLLTELTFNKDVCGVVVGPTTLVVSCIDEIRGYGLPTLSPTFVYECFPTYGLRPVVAVGTRWLAYAGAEPLPKKRVVVRKDAPSETAAGRIGGVAVDLASGVVSGFMYLGDMGVKSVSNYLYPTGASPPGVAPLGNPLPADDAHAHALPHMGSVIVRDLQSGNIIAHFKAHEQALTYMTFDPSGSMLVTATDGHNFHVFQILPRRDPVDLSNNARMIYKLKRGVTNASVSSITFSADSRWMCACSGRATIHVYGLNPTGGPATIRTHMPSVSLPPVSYLAEFTHPYPPQEMTLASLTRIHHDASPGFSPGTSPSQGVPVGGVPARGGAAVGGRVSASPPHSSLLGGLHNYLPPGQPVAVAFAPSLAGNGAASDVRSIFVMTASGMLINHLIKPARAQDAPRNEITCSTEPVAEWDVQRRPTWPEVLSPFAAPSNRSSPDGSASAHSWPSHVEIATHSTRAMPLWNQPQFVFETYEPNPRRLAAEDRPVSAVPMRRGDLVPLHEASDGTMSIHVDVDSSAPSGVAGEPELTASLLDAMGDGLGDLKPRANGAGATAAGSRPSGSERTRTPVSVQANGRSRTSSTGEAADHHHDDSRTALHVGGVVNHGGSVTPVSDGLLSPPVPPDAGSSSGGSMSVERSPLQIHVEPPPAEVFMENGTADGAEVSVPEAVQPGGGKKKRKPKAR